MPQHWSEDGKYMFNDQTESDGNKVLYKKLPNGDLEARWNSVADEQQPAAPPPPTTPLPSPPPPVAQGGIHLPIPLTDPTDGPLGTRSYAYWPQVWLHTPTLAYAFVGHTDGHPRFVVVDLARRTVTRRGPLLDQCGYYGTGEGLYFDRAGWITYCEGPRLIRANPFNGELIVLVDVSGSRPGHDLWQAHSSDDGKTHCMTVRRIVQEGSYPKVGTLVVQDGQETFYPAVGTLDESALTANASHLIIKETRDDGTPDGSEDNYIVPLASPRDAYWIGDRERALGHSDCGAGWMVGEADKPDPGQCGTWDLTTRTYHGLFDTTNMGYVAVRAQRILHSSDTAIRLIDIATGTARDLVTYPDVHVLHPQPDDYYDHRVKANLSPDGSVAFYQLEGIAYLLEVA